MAFDEEREDTLSRKRLQLKVRNKVKLETRSFNEEKDCEARSTDLPVSYGGSVSLE